jgi:hypothetical protein
MEARMSDRRDAITLETIERLIRETEADICRQEVIIKELQQDGRPAVGAVTLLRLLESDLASYRKVLEYHRRPQN